MIVPDRKLYFAKLHNDARIPSKKDEDAGYDIYPCFEGNVLLIEPGEIVLVPTAIASAFSENYVMVVKERSSTGAKGMSVRMGVVDSGYRGEIKIGINNTSTKKILIAKDLSTVDGDDYVVYPYEKAIAQLLLLPLPKFEVGELSYEELVKYTSERMDGTLGSSGK